jgi:diaminopimelate decarboxylase
MTVVRTVIGWSKALTKSLVRRYVAKAQPQIHPAAPEHWGLTRTRSGALALDGLVLHELGQQWGFPLHIVHAARLRDNARRFLAVPDGRERGCEVYYSYKTNPVPGVLAELHALGLGAEVISHYELWLARQLGVPPEKIVFNGPAKSDASIREAIGAGIQLLNVNHREEIGRVAAIARQMQRRPRVGVRVTVGEGWSGQFGVPVANGHALAAYEEARRTPHLDVVGIHAHRGGMIRTREQLLSFVDGVLSFVEELYARTGLALEVLNFGGSLSAPTVRGLSARDLRMNRTFQRDLTPAAPSASLSIEGYVSALTRRVEEHFRARGRPRPRIFVEPGRAVTSDAQLLLTSVLTLKKGAAATFLVLDAGINLAESCRSEYHQLFPANRAPRPADTVYTVVGPICTPGDTLYWAARLPALSPGDSLAIMDAGAYFVPFATSFSFPQPPIAMIDHGVVTLLRRGERFEDLIAYDRRADPAAGGEVATEDADR